MGTAAIVVLAAVSAALIFILVRALAAKARMARSFTVLESVAAVGERDLAVEQTLQEITEALVPAVADFCMIDVITEGRPHRAAVRVGPGGRPGIEEGLSHRKPALPVEMVVGSVDAVPAARLRRDVSETDLEELAHDPDDRAFLRGIGMRSFVILPLRARDRTTGALTLAVAWSGRHYGTEAERFFRVLKGRVSLALDNAGLFSDLGRSERTRAEIAETLQRGLLPPPLPHIPGWSTAAMYRPAGAENEVGGDFYDAFPVADGWMVVVGDVTGRGARAASITGQARYTLRTAASLTGDPLVALATLNRALLGRRDSALCTVAAFTLPADPTQSVRLAVAGHPPPMLVVGESVIETVASGPLLGAFEDVEWRLERLRVEAGQLLVVITDGVTEAAGPAGRFGEERLRSLLAETRSPVAAVQRLEGAMHEFTEGRFVDDAAILALARTADGGGDGAGGSFGDLPPLVAQSRRPMADSHRALVERLYDAFNRRDVAAMTELCDERMEFRPITAEEVGRDAPYVGPTGLDEYLHDIASVWDELLILPKELESRGDRMLVRGRVYLRSHLFGIRDLPAAWVWEVKGGHFVGGEVFIDPEEAAARFAAEAGP